MAQDASEVKRLGFVKVFDVSALVLTENEGEKIIPYIHGGVNISATDISAYKSAKFAIKSENGFRLGTKAVATKGWCIFTLTQNAEGNWDISVTNERGEVIGGAQNVSGKSVKEITWQNRTSGTEFNPMGTSKDTVLNVYSTELRVELVGEKIVDSLFVGATKTDYVNGYESAYHHVETYEESRKSTGGVKTVWAKINDVDVSEYKQIDQDARTGASRILLEDKYLFDMIGDDEIDKKYPLIIIATARPLSAAEVEKFKIYADNGGKILAQGSAAGSLVDGGVDLGFTEITADDLTPCYYVSKYPIKAGNGVPLVVFGKSWNIKASGEVLCDKLSPYFKREGSNFCSHAHTPCDYDKVSPAITVGKHGIAVASDLFTLYATDGGMTAKVLITPLIERLLNNKKTVITDLPSSGKVTLYRKGNGLTLHLVYANTVVRGGGNTSVEVIEDIITISCVNVSLKAEKPVKVVLRPDGKELPFIYENGTVNFSLKDFNCYAAIEFIY